MAPRTATKAAKAAQQPTEQAMPNEPGNAAPAVEPVATVPPSDWQSAKSDFVESRENLPPQGRVLVDVMGERARQVEEKGYRPERDAQYRNGELAMAAACYAQFASGQRTARSVFSWPFESAAFRPHDKRRAMVKAAALLLAAIEAHDLAEAGE